MKKTTALQLLRGAAVTCGFLMTASIGAGAIANRWESNLNEALGTVSSKIVTSNESTAEELFTYRNNDIKNTDDLVKWHKELAEREQEEGSVLLKNTGALPLAAGAKITLLGRRSVMPVYGGQIGSSPNGAQNVSLVDALKDRGFDVNASAISAYEEYAKTLPTGFGADSGLANSFGMVTGGLKSVGVYEPTVSQLEGYASGWGADITSHGDAAVVVLGRPSSEAADFYPGATGVKASEYAGGGNILGLSDNEKAIIDYACENDRFGKVIVLVNSDSPMELEYLKTKGKVGAILWIGAPGNYGFYGVADLIKGVVSPSGHLPDTYAVSSVSSPAMVNYGLFKFANYASYNGNTDNSKGFAFLDEKEGIYTGYQYYETRYEDTVLNRYNAKSSKGATSGSEWNYDNEVSYSFGYGLSYTTFTQEIVGTPAVDEAKGTISVTVKVTNTGDKPGKDVVQVYVQTPYTDYDRENHIEKSAIRLAGFEKTEEIAAGGNETVTVTFDKKYIASYDYVNAKTYILDAGDYYLAIGNGAHEALNNVLQAKDGTLGVGDASKTWKWSVSALDKTTYATSNGVSVTNQLDDMNLNYWKGDKSKLWEGQLSRQDWEGTYPVAYAVDDDFKTNLEATAAMIKELTNDVYSEEGGNTEATHWGRSTGLTIGALKGAAFDDERWDELLSCITLEEALYFYTGGQNWTQAIASIALDAQHVQDGPLGFSYQPLGQFNENTKDDPQAMSADDKNAGYSIYDSVTEPVLAASFNKKLLEEQGELFGTDSLWCNSAILWAPGLNTHRTPYNGRNHEYYSEDAMLTNYMGAAIVKGAYKYGLVLAPKHFAFNDQETNRTGVSVFMNEQRAREIELRAFQGAFDDAGCLGTMTAFNRAGIRYASAHKGLITNILQKEWDFKGYVVTDLINGPMYMRADAALMAGTTALDTSQNETSVSLMDGIKNSNVVQNALKDAMHRNLYVLANSNAMNGVDKTSRLVKVMPWWKAALISAEVITSVFTAAAVAGYVVVQLKKKEDDKEVTQ